MICIDLQCSKNETGSVRLELKWPDQHESVFNLEWLREHSFDANTQRRWLKNNYQFEKVTWNTSNFKDILRYFSFDELMHRLLLLIHLCFEHQLF